MLLFGKCEKFVNCAGVMALTFFWVKVKGIRGKFEGKAWGLSRSFCRNSLRKLLEALKLEEILIPLELQSRYFPLQPLLSSISLFAKFAKISSTAPFRLFINDRTFICFPSNYPLNSHRNSSAVPPNERHSPTPQLRDKTQHEFSRLP
jgi:hypothetical protein